MSHSLPHAIILGAGRPFRGVVHAGLRKVGAQESVLDWLLYAFKFHAGTVQFIGGYSVDSVEKKYPDLTYTINSDWQQTGGTDSLKHGDFTGTGGVLISYSDIVFHPEELGKLIHSSAGNIVVAIDASYPHRHKALSNHQAQDVELFRIGAPEAKTVEFVGLLYVPHEHVALFLQELHQIDPGKKHLSYFIQSMMEKNCPISLHDMQGVWSDLNDPSSLTRFVMGSKAETLNRLQDRLEHGIIPPQYRFDCHDYASRKLSIIHDIQEKFNRGLLAIRSSALSEDSFLSANAGVFHSVVNVPLTAGDIERTIEEVIASFPDDGGAHQVFVQPMVENVIASGVIFTRLLRNGAPYYRINYACGEDTTAVTSGHAVETQSLVVFRGVEEVTQQDPVWSDTLIKASKELEFTLDHDALDIEFAVDADLKVFILQVRPLVLTESPSDDVDEEIQSRLHTAQNFLSEMQAPSDKIRGALPAYGVMPDWNPAEIIGIHPTWLASSLYDFLIMNDAWAQQRAEFGYHDVRPHKLMLLFCGQPYVDVRASLNSFVPAEVSSPTAEKLINFCVSWLKNHPSLHDKIEFDVIPTCFSFDFDRWTKRLSQEALLSHNEISEIKKGLLAVTNGAFLRIDNDHLAIKSVQENYEQLSGTLPEGQPILNAVSLLEACRQQGTVLFAHLARSGFIATILLRSAVQMGYLDTGRVNEYLLSIHTVSSRFQRDAWRVKTGSLSFDAFVNEYGHLRPGSYDATSLRYDENPAFYLDAVIQNSTPIEDSVFSWRNDEIELLEREFNRLGLNVSFAQFDHFCHKAIHGREEAKFVFTRYLSEAIQYFIKAGASMGLTRDDVANIALPEWTSYAEGGRGIAYLQEKVREARLNAYYNMQIELPPLIFDQKDFVSFRVPDTQPNFITEKSIIAPLYSLEQGEVAKDNLCGKIVRINAADPGYDWLFGYRIAGLITQYGGANSHMAIRAAEFGLPAAIGIGSEKYHSLDTAKRVDLDCRARLIRIIK